MRSYFVILLTVICFNSINGQRGKDGDKVISSNSIVNEYTTLTNNVSAGSNTLVVSSSNLNLNNRFSSSLQPGDLILIIQMQGATIDNTTFGYGWGAITSYNNCGNYEFVEVSSVPNSTTINLRCGLKYSYTSNGHVQVIRVPRYNSLTLNSSVTAQTWNGSTGGIVSIETLGNVILNGSIDVSGLGFRGGQSEITNSYWGAGFFGSNDHNEGAAKGESIVGYVSEYNALSCERTQGAPANGGGGGNGHNSGGGGGGNGGNISSYTIGIGVPNPNYNAAWNLETPSISGAVTSGGGKGGYSFSGSAQNPLSVAPGNSAWNNDLRRNVGGRGGRPLDYSSGKIFIGGGGGAGDKNNSLNTGGSGGSGGGLVFLSVYGNITGSGSIIANGNNGESVTSTNPPITGYAGEDAAGGGGAGGTIILDVIGTISNITCTANGGNGGNQTLVHGQFHFSNIVEAEGPGGGGSGGKILSSTSGFTSSLIGGIAGTTNSSAMPSFPQNGATDGGSGDSQIISSNLIEISALNDTICAGNSTMLTVSANVTLPSGTSFIWYDAPNNGNFIGAGSAFSTGNLSNDTTFYVGICPGNYTIPVSVIMGASFSSNVNNVIVSDENCGQSDGSITGITINGGVQPLQYEWNTILTSNQDLIGASAGNYTLVVTDGNGCASTIGTFNLGENTGPSIDINNMIINDDHCNQGIGSITGITATGQLPLNIEWNGIMSSSFDLSNIETGTYDLSVTDNFGCTSSINNLIVNNTDGPLIDTSNIQISPETCGSLNGSIANIQVSGISPLSYYWNGNSSNLNLQNIASGLYDLIVEDSFGCSDTILDIYVDAIGYPTANFNFTPDVIYEGDTVYFIDSSFSNISNIVFTLSDGSISNDSITFEVFPERGVYEVCLWVENNFGCADSICQNITVQPNISNINVPNVFTPNGDLNNQYFSILGLDNNYSLSIFNRWGTLLFSESPYLNLWDGTTSSGAELSEGTYYFILEPIENSNGDLQTYSGAVTLIR